MKKLFLTMLLLMVLTFGAAQTSLAADVPVYLEGERVATGLERGGYTYLPLRTMFETVGASVEWSEPEQKIIATFADGGVLTMQVGNNYADAQYHYRIGDEEYDNPSYPYMEQPPFVSRGITYVPLRFISDDVLGYEVDWRDNAVYITQPRLEYTQGEDKYILNMANGELWLNDKLITNQAKVPGYAGYHAQHVYGFEVRRTPAGSYLLDGSGTSLGFMAYSLQWNCWISADGQKGLSDCNTSMLDDFLPGIVCSEGKVWLNGYSHNFCIDEASGQINQVDTQAWASQVTGDEYACGSVRWTAGRLILLGDGGGYVLYDMQNQTGHDLVPLLLTDEVKAKANNFMADNSSITFDVNNADYYWEGLGAAYKVDPVPYLKFTGEENGKLNFELICGYYATSDGGQARQVFPLSYTLQ